jgi:hypothetical protein
MTGAAQRPASVRAQTFLHRLPSSSSGACAFLCDDGRTHCVKGRQNGRVAANDQVVGRLAQLLAVAVPETSLVEVTAALIGLEPQIAHFIPGVGHGCLWVDDVTDRLGLDYAQLPENRPRFAGLAVLYSWAGVCQDHQLLYKKPDPHLVYSVDHGHFLHGGPNWTSQTLAAAPGAILDPFFASCGLTAQDYLPYRQALRDVADEPIAIAVSTPPDEWGVTLEERIDLADYLARRRSQLLAVLPQ